MINNFLNSILLRGRGAVQVDNVVPYFSVFHLSFCNSEAAASVGFYGFGAGPVGAVESGS